MSTRFDRRWLVVLATPALAWVVGIAALPHPQGVAAEQAAFDRSTVTDVVGPIPALPQKKADATFGGIIQLRGVDLPEVALSRGARLGVTLHFAPVAVIDGDWQVFVHIDAQGSASSRINADHWPAGGRYRTGLWQVGEHIRDRFEQTIPRGAPAGVYDVWVGFYRGETRLPVTSGDRGVVDADNRVKVGTIVVE
jgi:hypothetical protein